MLTEFLLTPDVLADSDGRDGSDVVRELKTCLFPFAGASIALVCKLGGEEWTRAVSRRVARIANTNHRQLAMSLLTHVVEQLSVTRPAVPRRSDDEVGWIDAGVQSSAQVPLARIVVSGRSAPPTPLEASLREFVSPAFWERLPNPRLVGRDTAAQEEVLRAICAHSDWLLMRLPQIRGSSDDEVVTVKQIVRLSNNLPAGFRRSHIDLHVCLARNIPERRLVHAVSGELRPFIQRGARIELTVWPQDHFINRELIGGDYATTAPGTTIRKALWLVTMSHVAVGGTHAALAGGAGNTWSLFPRNAAHTRMSEIEGDTPLNKYTLR
jgi:hypothetical protein